MRFSPTHRAHLSDEEEPYRVIKTETTDVPVAAGVG